MSAPAALITGGGGGIGRATCLEFAKVGYRIAVCDSNAEAAEQTAMEVRHAGGEAQVYAVDIAQSEQVQEMIGAVRKRFGRIDAAFNNAGVPGKRIPLAEIMEDDWERVMRTNLTGTFLCMKYEILAMLEQGGGCIVNNSSILGLGGGVNAPYTASKHGVCGLTKSAALAYAERGVRINAVCPALIEAGMGLRVLARSHPDPKDLIAEVPMNRMGSAPEVAKAVVWLCSDSASFVHGHMMAIDGGYGAR